MPSHHPFRMERVLYNLHHQLCTSALQQTSRRGRLFIEHGVLILAVCCFGVLLLLHWSFVYRGGGGGGGGGGDRGSAVVSMERISIHKSIRDIPSRCLLSIEGFSLDADVTHLRMLVDSSSSSSSSRPSYAFISMRSGTDHNDTCFIATDDHNESQRFPVVFSYSRVKGYLLLPTDLYDERRMTIQNVMLSPSDPNCFGEPFLRALIFSFTGAETTILNWLLALNGATGYVANPRSTTNDGILDLEQHYNMEAGFISRSRWRKHQQYRKQQQQQEYQRTSRSTILRQFFSKLTVVIKTSFLFFIITTLVSFTLRETQERMIDFTHQLRDTYARTGGSSSSELTQQRWLGFMSLPYVTYHIFPLVARHLVENLLFVPIMIGMIFFLIEFYRGDKFLAFMVVSLVWFCEVFTALSLRSSQGLHFFPRIFFLLFSLFHFYLFLYPFGFSYTALISTVLFVAHSMLFFWHRYELPAIAHGIVTIDHPRMAMASALTGAHLPSPPPTQLSSESSPNTQQNEGAQYDDDDDDSSPPRTQSILWPARRADESSFLEPSDQAEPQNSHSPTSLFDSSNISRSGSGSGSASMPDETDSHSSYTYYMNGEVVNHRTNLPCTYSSSSTDPLSRNDSFTLLPSLSIDSSIASPQRSVDVTENISASWFLNRHPNYSPDVTNHEVIQSENSSLRLLHTFDSDLHLTSLPRREVVVRRSTNRDDVKNSTAEANTAPALLLTVDQANE